MSRGGLHVQRQGNLYTFLFAFAVCVTCSLALSVISEGLKTQKELNVALDIKKNILKAVNLETPLPAKAPAQKILDVYAEKIMEEVIDGDGNVVEGKVPADIKEGEALYPIYV